MKIIEVKIIRTKTGVEWYANEIGNTFKVNADDLLTFYGESNAKYYQCVDHRDVDNGRVIRMDCCVIVPPVEPMSIDDATSELLALQSQMSVMLDEAIKLGKYIKSLEK